MRLVGVRNSRMEAGPVPTSAMISLGIKQGTYTDGAVVKPHEGEAEAGEDDAPDVDLRVVPSLPRRELDARHQQRRDRRRRLTPRVVGLSAFRSSMVFANGVSVGDMFILWRQRLHLQPAAARGRNFRGKSMHNDTVALRDPLC